MARKDTPTEETASGWGCPHEFAGRCQRLERPCRPGIPGCVLYRWMKKPAGGEPDKPSQKED